MLDIGTLRENWNYLLMGGPFWIQASPATSVSEEPACITVLPGIVVKGCLWLQWIFFEDSMRLPISWWVIYMNNEQQQNFVSCWRKMWQKWFLCYRQLTKKRLWVKHRFMNGFLILNGAKCWLMITLLPGVLRPAGLKNVVRICQAILEDHHQTIDELVELLSANFMWRFQHKEFQQNLCLFCSHLNKETITWLCAVPWRSSWRPTLTFFQS